MIVDSLEFSGKVDVSSATGNAGGMSGANGGVPLNYQASLASGGSVDIKSAGRIYSYVGSSIKATGVDGGYIRVAGGNKRFVSQGDYDASGINSGGSIDLTAIGGNLAIMNGSVKATGT